MKLFSRSFLHQLIFTRICIFEIVWIYENIVQICVSNSMFHTIVKNDYNNLICRKCGEFYIAILFKSHLKMLQSALSANNGMLNCRANLKYPTIFVMCRFFKISNSISRSYFSHPKIRNTKIRIVYLY